MTVGTQLPFDRLVSTVVSWADARSVDVVAQIGPSRCTYPGVRTYDFLPPTEAKSLFQRADVVVSHAGMGSILSALEIGKPIVIFPRRFDLGEHRNDHQMATARRFLGRSGIWVAFDEDELLEVLERRNEFNARSCERISPFASAEFIDRLKVLLR